MYRGIRFQLIVSLPNCVDRIKIIKAGYRSRMDINAILINILLTVFTIFY